MSPVRKTVAALTAAVPLTLGIAAGTAFAGVRWQPAGTVQIGTCTLVAQPWNHTQFGLEVTHADGSVETLLEQTYDWLDDTRWTFPAGDLQTIRWARDVTTWEWLDTYQITPDCRFATPYKADPQRQDSLVLEAGFVATSTPAPTTTTSTTVAVPEQPTTTTPYTEQTVVDEPPVQTTWASTPPPEQPSTTVPEATTSSAPVVELITTEQLPFTGDHTGLLTTAGAAVVALGGAFIAKARQLAG